jgi:PEGA domain-containing protein
MPREREAATAAPRASVPSSGFARGVPRTPPEGSSGPSVTPVQPAQASQGFARGVPRAGATVSPSLTAVEPERGVASDSGQRFAQPRRVPRPEDYPQNANVAVPRGSVVSNPRPGDASVYVPGTARGYSNYYYYPPYPRHVYPHGYGGFGLGYFYYDPYTWYDTYYPTYPAYGSYYAASPYTYNYGYATGEIRLQVRPRHAEVYVDGYYAGRVDDFDGFLQGLRLEEGPHTIEIVAAGYETLVFNVRIVAGRKIDYRADLSPY